VTDAPPPGLSPSGADAFEGGLPHADSARSFGEGAAAYERGRPSYPREAVDWLLPEGARHVVDLGAGTGKFTRLLVDRVERVTAVEPSARMRAELVDAVPTAEVLAGSAERLPLGDDSVDAVLVAQAWHWVDPVRAVPEVARVLRPGGVLGLVWNVRDPSAPWATELEGIIRSASESGAESLAPRVGPPFSAVERRDVAWVNTVSTEEFVAMVASRSYFLTLQRAERDVVESRVRRLLAEHPALAGRSAIEVPYVTRCSRAILLAG
jgi:SAM-dependent methyltransferase